MVARENHEGVGMELESSIFGIGRGSEKSIVHLAISGIEY